MHPHSYCLSAQVIDEFIANAILPRKLGMSREEAVLYCQAWEAEVEEHSLTRRHLERAWEWFLPGHLSLWDSLILASTNLAECDRVYSEDLNHGQVFGSVKAIDPFR